MKKLIWVLLGVSMISAGCGWRSRLPDEVNEVLDQAMESYENEMSEAVEDAKDELKEESKRQLSQLIQDNLGGGEAGISSAFANYLQSLLAGNENEEVLQDMEENIEELAQEETDGTVNEYLQKIMDIMNGQKDTQSLSKIGLLRLQILFPEGKYWNHLCTDSKTTRSDKYQNSVTDHPCSHTESVGSYDCNHVDGFGAYGQCWGFVRKMAHEYFGDGYELVQINDISQLKPGDTVRYHPGSQDHSIWVYEVDGDNITYADCNFPGSCVIHWNRKTTKSEISKKGFLFIETAQKK